VFLAGLVLLALTVPGVGFGVTFTAEVDRSRVAVGEQVTLTVTVEGPFQTLPPIELPPLDGVDAFSGGTSQSFRFVNGKTSASVTSTFFLQVRRVGSLTIPALEIEIQGRTYRTQPIPVTVMAAADQGGPAGADRTSPGGADRTGGEVSTGSGGGGRLGDEVFITLDTDATSAFVGEQIVLTFRYYRRVQLWESPQYKAPKAEGFWREDLPPERNYIQTIASYRYHVTELRYALFPTRPGSLTIEPAEVTIPVDIFDRFFSSRRSSRNRPQRLRTDPIIVEVSPLPSPRPTDFCGVVARQLTLTAEVDRDTVPRGEPVGLTVELVADGFLKGLDRLPLPEPAGARMHDAREDLNVDKSGERLLSRYTVEKVVVPAEEGFLELDPIRVVYFNPGRARYETARKAGLRVLVTPSDLPVAGDAPSGFLRSGIERLGRDLAFIHPVEGKLSTRLAPFPATVAWWAALLAPLVGLAVLRWRLDRLERLRRDPAGWRRRRALRQARRLLQEAGRAREASAGFSLLARAIFRFVADKTGEQAAALESVAVRRYTDRLNRSRVGKRLGAILAVCDGYRYGGGRSEEPEPGERSEAAGQVVSLLRETDTLLAELERAEKRRSRSPGAGARTLLTGIGLLVVAAGAAAQESPRGGPGAGRGPDPARLLAEGNQAYTAGDIDTALLRYQAVLDRGVNEADLHYNLGNAFARRGELGRAILSYLRAERLAPRDRDVRGNLTWVRTHIRDLELETGDMPAVIGHLVRVVRALSLDELSLALVVVVWIVCGLVAVAWIRGAVSDGLRRLLLTGAAVLVILLAVTGWRWYEERIRDLAVVVVEEVEVRSGPAASFPVVFRIHDGLTLTIRGRREGWTRIGLGGEWIGWVPDASVEPVRLDRG